jgi:predicted nucleotidyltransferase
VAEGSRDYSLRRLRELGERLEPAQALLSGHPLCVCATGSYGRLEAWKESDADVFFLYDDADATQRLPLTSFIRFAALLIKETDAMNFPPFSGDGRYLGVQYVGEMENAFTARMLLLLESQPVYNEATYIRLLERIVGFYYRDYADHSDEFLPTILLNDILRFWRTLTLNYEHHRLKLKELVGDALERKKADSALKNYKLKVSRLATCFSMVTSLSAEPVPVTPEKVLELCRITPAQRFERLQSHSPTAEQLVGELFEAYGGFLTFVQRSEDELLDKFEVPETRKRAHAEAKSYGDIIYRLLIAVTPSDRMRFLVI